jgi:hypothetical protein
MGNIYSEISGLSHDQASERHVSHPCPAQLRKAWVRMGKEVKTVETVKFAYRTET